jgi:catechol 2,3-dioxygenase-like lactoylglutathione lyase family enzyme
MTTVQVHAFDHLVLRCADVEVTLAWYVDRLGLGPERVSAWRAGEVPFPSVRVDPGTILDLIPARGPLEDGRLDHLCLVVEDLSPITAPEFDVIEGPVQRFGARGMATSIYVRDPDGLVVELRTYP